MCLHYHGENQAHLKPKGSSSLLFMLKHLCLWWVWTTRLISSHSRQSAMYHLLLESLGKVIHESFDIVEVVITQSMPSLPLRILCMASLGSCSMMIVQLPEHHLCSYPVVLPRLWHGHHSAEPEVQYHDLLVFLPLMHPSWSWHRQSCQVWWQQKVMK